MTSSYSASMLPFMQKTNGAIQGQKQQVRGGAQGFEQRRNKDVRVENDANHEPSCSVVVST